MSSDPVVDQLPPVTGYDLIGDVHGCAATLGRLLERMGYHKVGGVYQHPRRRAIFLGDIVDRGPRVREALHIVRDMVERGSAQMIIGNHEFNAITYCTPARPGSGRDYLRPHIPRNTRQIAETLEQFANYPHEWNEFIEWFKKLPLFLEIGGAADFSRFRVVHACWDNELIAAHCERYGSGHFDMDFVYASAEQGTLEARTKQRLTSGVDLPLPEGVKIVSSDGYVRDTFRTKFWVPQPENYGELLFQPDPLPDDIARAPIRPEHRQQMVNYGADQPPLFVGHYWLKGKPQPIAHNLACLDYSAVKYGRLVAYRMDGEAHLRAHKYVWEYVDP
ncbi:MAG: metallophosphoesterase [Cellvibrio sp.]